MAKFDFLGILKDYFRENKKNILVSAIGFIFIVSVLTVTLTTDFSLKKQYIIDQIGEDGLEINLVVEDTTYDDYTNLEDGYNNIMSEIEQTVDEKGLSQYFIYQKSSSTTISFDTKFSPSSYGITKIGTAGDYEFNSLESSSRFEGRLAEDTPNGTSTEVVFIEDITNFQGLYSLDEEIMISHHVSSFYQVGQFYNTTIKIVGIYYTEVFPLEVAPDVFEYRLKDDLLANLSTIEYNAFYTTENNLAILEGNLRTNSVYKAVKTQVTISLVNKINPETFGATIKKINSAMRDLALTSNYYMWKWIKSDIYGSYNVDSSYKLNEFLTISGELENNYYLSIILMLPAFCITIIFTYFVSNIFFDSRKEQIGILRIRGINRFQLMGILAIEGFLASVVSLIIGYFIGVIFSTLTINSTAFLDYNFSFEYFDYNQGTFSAVAISTFILAGIIIIFRSINLSRIDFKDTSNPLEKIPTWKKRYFDIIIFIVGIIGNMIYLMIIFNPSLFVSVSSSLAFTTVLTYIFMPFPFLLLFGGILSVSRIFPVLIRFISQKSWKNFANLFSYSLTTMVRQKEAVLRTILMLAITISMVWALFIIPPVLENNAVRSSYYSVGADCYYDHPWFPYLEERLTNDTDNIEGFTRMGTMRLEISGTIDVFIIDDNFLDVAFFENSFCSKESVRELLESEMGLLLIEREFNDLGSKIGQNITIKGNTFNTTELTIIDTFNYWPRLVTKPYAERSSTKYDSRSKMVISIDTVNELVSKGVISSYDLVTDGYYLKLTEEADYLEVKSDYYQYHTPLVIAPVQIESNLAALLYDILYLHLNDLLIVIFSTFMLTILLYGFRQVRGRTREISVERSLGMTMNQQIKLFFFETLSILGFSFIFGSLLGIFFAITLSSILLMSAVNTVIPPPALYFPLLEINITEFILIAFGLVISILPILFSREEDITKSLKVK